MCYIQLTAHSWQQAWFSTLHCEPGFSLHPLVSQHGSNSWQFFRKKWKEKGNFMWIKNFSQSEAGEGGCLYLQKRGFIFRTSYFSEIVIGENFHENRLQMKYIFFVKNEVCYETSWLLFLIFKANHIFIFPHLFASAVAFLSLFHESIPASWSYFLQKIKICFKSFNWKAQQRYWIVALGWMDR